MDGRPGVETAALPPWWKQRTPLTGLGFAAAGLIAGGFGLYYVAVDGNTLEKDKINGNGIMVRNTSSWGWSLLGLGAASLAIGSAMIIWGREDGTEISVAVGPASMALQGRF
jgi:multisubunit Na+/H+ antiporter MnhB subunit